VLDGFTTQHNDKRFTTVGIDVGNGMTKSLNQLGTTFLHGKPSLHYYSVKVYFYSFLTLGASDFYPYLSPARAFPIV